MAKALVITEKPSVARDIVQALGGFEEFDKGEYWESPDYICTYAVGHLLELLEPEEIDKVYRRWSLETLPIIPDTFKLKAKKQHEKRLKTIKKLIGRKDVDRLINACDAAREGELIFRELVQFYESPKPNFRLWLQSMTKDSIRKGFEKLAPGENHEGLAKAAECRARSDWLIGMNASRALSIRLRTRSARGAWSAGRVQTPTLGLLVERELEILSHVPEPYWKILGQFNAGSGNYEGIWYDPKFKKDPGKPDAREDRIFDKAKAEAIANKILNKTGTVSETRKSRKQMAPVLFNLTALQKAMSNRYGWSSKRTLQAAQRCYESHKVLTYPRTNSSCLPVEYKAIVDELVSGLCEDKTYGSFAKKLMAKGRENEKRTFDDAGVSDHFAIIPTGQVPQGLSGDDARLYDAVVRRFLATFFPPAVFDKVERVTVVEGESFKTGPIETLAVPGWQEVYEKDKEEQNNKLPPLIAGQKESKDVPTTSTSVETNQLETKPPNKISEARLLTLMETAGKSVEDSELASALMSAEGLGTAATRADIIENLKSKEYIQANLRPTPKGIRLIESLERIGAKRLTSAELTANLELHLAQVESGERKAEEFMAEIVDYIKDVVESVKEMDFEVIYPDKDELGTCPVCGTSKKVYEKAWFYACETNKRDQKGCDFLIWKDNSNRYIDRVTAEELLRDGETRVLDGFSDINGETFKAKLIVDKNKVTRKIVEMTTGTEEDSESAVEINPEPLGICPIHGEGCMVSESSGAYICETRLKEMKEGKSNPKGFILPRAVCKRSMLREEVVVFMETRETPFFKDFISKRGRKFSSKLVLRPDGRHEFEFPPKAPKKSAKTDSEGEAEANEEEKSTSKATTKAKKNKSTKTKSSKAAASTNKVKSKEANDSEAPPWE